MASSDRPPVDPSDNALQRRRREREELIRLAHANVERQAYAQYRERMRVAHEAPPAPNRGPAGCAALVVLPLGLLLLTVHPLPGMLVLSLGAALHLLGSRHLDRTRQQLREADADTDRRWQGTAAGPRPR